ncbi:MAG: RNA polymerase sigma-70 factor [Prolixibacteraceae bacterium]
MRRTSPDMTDDCILMNELKEGSAGAFDVIFRKYYDNLCRFAFSLVKDADLSQSLVQNVFVKLWERRHQSGDIRNLAGYLTIMVKNQVFDYIHDQKKNKLIFKDSKKGIADESTENEIFRKNFEECLVVALSMLPDRCRQAFELSRFENLSNKEIADKLGISVKGVEALIGRSLKFLRTELREFLPSFHLKDNLVLFLFGILPTGVYVDTTGITKN